jgi:hypothetical protein
MRRGGLLIGAALALGPATAAEPGLDVTGHVEHVLHLTDQDLRALPQTTVDATFQTGHGPQTGPFSGTRLWAVIDKAGIAEPPGTKGGHHLGHDIRVIGRDGYAVVIALGEIDPDFEGKSVLLTEGPDGLKLIVPGDKHAGRNVHDIVRIEVD